MQIKSLRKYILVLALIVFIIATEIIVTKVIVKNERSNGESQDITPTPVTTVIPTSVPASLPQQTIMPTPTMSADDEKRIAELEFKNLKLIELDALSKEEETADYGISTADMVETIGYFYTKYDDLLNEIYQHLKENMPESEFEALRNEQRQWLKDKDAEIDRIYQNGGTMAHIEGTSYNAECTKKRCYELLEYIK